MRWLVSGGRKFADIRFVYDKLDGVAKEHGMPSLLIHGAARGVDSIADRWAQVNNVERFPMPADWEGDGHAAGPRRNSRMLELNPDLCIIFPGGNGTRDMYQKARAVGHFCILFGTDTFI